MSNAYPYFQTRTTHDLAGSWSMAILGDVNPDDVNVAHLRFDHLMAVPGCYDTQAGCSGLRGVVAIRRRLRVTPGTRGRLHIGGLGLWARVIVDGQALDDCHLPYCPWSVSVPASDTEEREVVLLIDNRFGPDRALLFDPYFDWYAHGGVYRAITWHELPAVAFDRATITTTDVASGSVRIDVRFDGLDAGEIAVRLRWDGAQPETHHLNVQGGIAHIDATVPNARAWTPCTPDLHELRLSLADGSDDIIERAGLRVLKAHQGQVLLNGEPLRLRGVNRHEYSPHAGPALSDAEIIHDLSLLKQLGANVVRGSHYQQDQRFLDRCDELGLIVWEESLGWQARTQHFQNPRFAELQEDQLRRMIRASANHPAVVFWGILNEGESMLPESRPVYERLAAAAREEDQTRMITYACNHPFDCINLDLCDVIAINQYPGWYPMNHEDPHPVGEIAPHLQKVLAHLDDAGFADVPKLMSEIGAGAIYGCRDAFRGHWSEEYQSDYLAELCRAIDAEPRWMGLCIWQFCDCRTKTGGMALGRPRSFNNKGLVDEYRRPKQAFDIVKAAFTAH